MQIEGYFRALLKGWWIVLASLLIGIGVAFFVSYSQSTIYSAKATYIVRSDIRTDDPSDLINSADTLASRTTLISTFCQVLQSQTVIAKVYTALLLPEEIGSAYSTSCSVLPETSIMEVEVRGPAPVLATDLANAIGASGIAFVQDLNGIYEIRVLDVAKVDQQPVSPDTQTDIFFGAIISLLIGSLIALIRGGAFSVFADEPAETFIAEAAS